MQINDESIQYKRGAIFSYLTLGLNSLTGIFFTPFIIRSLGENEYGLYQLIGAYAGYLSILDMGMSSAVTKYVTKYMHQNRKDKEENFLIWMIFYYTFISIIVGIIGSVMYHQLGTIFSKSLSPTEIMKAEKMFILLIISLIITLFGGIFRGVMNAYQRFSATKGAELVRVIFRIIVIYAVLELGSDSIGLVLMDTLINAIFFLYRFVYCKSKLHISFHYYGMDRVELKEIFFYSFFVFMNLLFDQLNWKVDHTILGIKMSTAAISIYSVGMNFSNYFMNFSVAIKSLFLPKVMHMELDGTNGEKYTSFLIKTGRMQGYILLYLYFAFLFLGRQFITLIMGENYDEAWLSALLVMTGLIIPLLQNAGHSILQAQNKHHIYVLVCLGVSIVNAGATWFIVESKGIVGAAFMTMLSFFLGQAVFLSFYYHKKIGIDMRKFYLEILRANFFPITGVIIIELLINTFTKTNSWLQFMIHGGFYSVIYFVSIFFGGMNRDEKNMLFEKVIKKK